MSNIKETEMKNQGIDTTGYHDEGDFVKMVNRSVDMMGGEPKHINNTNAVTFIEKNYPKTAVEFKKLQKEQYELFCKKQMDYGPSNIAMGTSLETDEEKRLSKIGLIVRINDKIQRLINLVVKNNRKAQNEPTIDAFKDLACYGIIAQIVEAGKWGK